MQTGRAACGPPLPTDSTARLRADDAEMRDSPHRRVYGGERKTAAVLVLVLRLLPLLMLMLMMLPLSAAGCSVSL